MLYRVVTFLDLPVKPEKLSDVLALFKATSLEPEVFEGRVRATALYAPLDIEFFRKLTPCIDAYHCILEFEKGTTTRWLHLFYQREKLVEQESGVGHRWEDGLYTKEDLRKRSAEPKRVRRRKRKKQA